MAGFMEMLCGVFSWRGIATADVAAGHTLAQVYPPSTFFKAFFAGIRSARRRKIGFSKIIEMFTWFIHRFIGLFCVGGGAPCYADLI